MITVLKEDQYLIVGFRLLFDLLTFYRLFWACLFNCWHFLVHLTFWCGGLWLWRLRKLIAGFCKGNSPCVSCQGTWPEGKMAKVRQHHWFLLSWALWQRVYLSNQFPLTTQICKVKLCVWTLLKATFSHLVSMPSLSTDLIIDIPM